MKDDEGEQGQGAEAVSVRPASLSLRLGKKSTVVAVCIHLPLSLHPHTYWLGFLAA